MPSPQAGTLRGIYPERMERDSQVKGIPVLRIDDFCKTGSGGTPSRTQMDRFYEGGTIPWIKSGELRESIINGAEEYVTEAALKETSIKLVPAGALLVAMYGATVGRLGILGIDATTNQAVCHILPDPKKADLRYLYHAMLERVPKLISMGVGGAQPNISQGLIKDLQIPIPPLPEQRRIAQILDKAEALQAKRRAALAKLDTLAQSIFLEMFGDPATNQKGWNVQTVQALISSGHLLDIQDGNHGERHPKVSDFIDEGVPFVMANCLRFGHIDLDVSYKLDPRWLRHLRVGFGKANDVLISHKGTVGEIAIISDETPIVILSPQVTYYRTGNGLLPKFLAGYFSTRWFQSNLAKEAIQSTRAYIGITRQKQMPVPLPPLPLQQAFARRVEAIEALKAAHRASLGKLDALFASLQHRAFRGEL